MSLRGRLERLLAKFDRRVTLVEDTAERIEGAVENMLEIGTELKGTAAALRAMAERLEAAVSEQGKTMANALEAMADERERRVGLGREVMHLSGRVDTLERRPGGAAQ